MKKLLCVLGALLVACSALTAPAPTRLTAPPIPAMATALAATIALVTLKGDLLVCAGQYVGPNEVLTAAHCLTESTTGRVAGFEGAKVKWYTWESWRKAASGNTPTPAWGSVIRIERADLAVLRADLPSPVWVTRALPPNEFDLVFAVGHPRGGLYTISFGRILDPHYEHAVLGDCVAAIVPVWFGSSGGGLYNWRGRLIGVTSRMQAAGSVSTLAFFVPVYSSAAVTETHKLGISKTPGPTELKHATLP